MSRQKKINRISLNKCSKCNDTGWILYSKEVNGRGYQFGRECECVPTLRLEQRYKNAMIPIEFTECRFDNYERRAGIQNKMFTNMNQYIKEFNKLDGNCNSFGFIATFGEQQLKELSHTDRSEALSNHNSYGLGKTHLQAAAATVLMNKGYSVWMVSDTTLMNTLAKAKALNDNGETFNREFSKAIQVDFLIWDDLGKTKYSETKEELYYNIINERYKAKKPIIFSSNEDSNTLRSKIGFAAGSRLLGMSKRFLIECEGDDYRIK